MWTHFYKSGGKQLIFDIFQVIKSLRFQNISQVARSRLDWPIRLEASLFDHLLLPDVTSTIFLWHLNKKIICDVTFWFCHFFSFVRRFRSFPKFLRLWYRSFNFCDFETLTFVTRDFWFSVTSHYLGVIISVKNNLDLSSKLSVAWRRKKLIKFSPWQQSKSQRIYGRNF